MGFSGLVAEMVLRRDLVRVALGIVKHFLNII